MSIGGAALGLGEKRSEDETERVRPVPGRRVEVEDGDERNGTGGGGLGSMKRDVKREESEGDDRLALSVRWDAGERRLLGLGFESEVEREMVLDPVRIGLELYDAGV